ncbi:type IV toxin-antitoxin system AbiEi family antitoxin domain-containing protein (plasmid) [Nocardia sp. CA-084685]|uniref:type IV toxin-antitoxin system AbiEi family antitoxin domain-containing protein n=1 Tax=Nocardia sp. CA-084685 TaxID=3239970 RepID=UPI003D96CFAF
MIVRIVKLAHLADGQSGLITGVQARGAGVTDSELEGLVDAGLLEQVIPGVVRMRAGGRHPFPRQFARWLLLEPHLPASQRSLPAAGVVAGATALRIYKLVDLPGPTEITTVGTSNLSQVPETVVTAGSLDAGDWKTVDGLPVVVAGRAFTDVVGSGRLDPIDLGRIAARILQSGLADDEELATRLEKTRVATGRDGDGRSWLTGLLASSDEASAAGA